MFTTWRVWVTALAATLLVGCGCCERREESTAYTGTRETTAYVAPTAKETTGCPVATPKTHVARITDGVRYDPQELTINAGDTVQWNNAGTKQHTVTVDPSMAKRSEDVRLPSGAEPFSSGNIDCGKSYSHTFKVPGTYKYVCANHPGETGMVIVNPAP